MVDNSFDLARWIAVFGYTQEWIDLEFIDIAFVREQAARFERGPDRDAEHYKWAAYRRVLEKTDFSNRERWREFVRLIEADPNEHLSTRASLLNRRIVRRTRPGRGEMGIVGTAFAAFIASRVANGPLRPRAGAVIVTAGFLVLGLASSEAVVPLIVACSLAFGLLWGSFVVLQRVRGPHLIGAVVLVLLATWVPGLLQEWLVDVTAPSFDG